MTSAIRNCFRKICVEPRAIEHAVGAGCHHPRFVIGPALPRLNQPKLRQTEIGHCARGGADILAKLRFDQHDNRTGIRDPVPGFVSACSGHGPLVIPGCRAAARPESITTTGEVSGKREDFKSGLTNSGLLVSLGSGMPYAAFLRPPTGAIATPPTRRGLAVGRAPFPPFFTPSAP
jgi:hypothetical protein